MQIVAKIRNKNDEWEEIFDVPKGKNPIGYIKEVIKSFNNSLRPGENPREFVCLVKQKTYKEMTDKELYSKFIQMKMKQISIIHRYYFDEIWGDDAKRIRECLDHKECLKCLYRLMHTTHRQLWERPFIELLEEMEERGWERLRGKE